MPLIILKKVWDYCTYNKKYILFILVLLFLSQMFQDYVRMNVDNSSWEIFQLIVFILLYGYGMEITRDRINHGVRLPKLIIKNIIVFGVKSSIVFYLYVFIQSSILEWFSSYLHFPVFNLKTMLLNFWQTLHLLYVNHPINTIIFLVVGSILFYFTIFFVEIALARLADTGSIVQSFNFKAILKNINSYGWLNYVKDYTLIIVAIVILSLIQDLEVPIYFIDYLKDVFLGFLIFVTQFLGIGAVYSEIKDRETNRKQIIVR